MAVFLRSTLVAAAAVALGLAGCAGTNQSGPPATSGSPAAASPRTAGDVRHAVHGECLVCKYRADLACVDVPVENDTPRAEYNGQTYYFCSDECRREFVNHPEKYAQMEHR